jgi:hypothetical protein
MNPAIEEVKARGMRIMLAEVVCDEPRALEGDNLERLAAELLEVLHRQAGEGNWAASGFLRCLYFGTVRAMQE